MSDLPKVFYFTCVVLLLIIIVKLNDIQRSQELILRQGDTYAAEARNNA